MEKNDIMPLAFSQDSLDMMETLIKVFDPDRRLNPGKVLPTGKGCLEVRPMTPRGQATDW
jgi:glycolate oxidase